MKYGLPILLGGGAMYYFYYYDHYDYSKEHGLVFIPKEKFKGTESYTEYKVDDNGQPLINPTTGEPIVEEVVTTARSVEDIFNYDSRSQAYFESSIVDDMIVASDTPEWQRQFITSRFELGASAVSDMENDVYTRWNRGEYDPNTSFYQAYDDYGDAKAAAEPTSVFATLWNRATELAYNKTDINLEDHGFAHNTGEGMYVQFGLLNKYFNYGTSDPTGGEQHLIGSLFDQHSGSGSLFNDGSSGVGASYTPGRFVRRQRHNYNSAVLGTEWWMEKDGEKIDSTDFTQLKESGLIVQTSKIDEVLSELGG